MDDHKPKMPWKVRTLKAARILAVAAAAVLGLFVVLVALLMLQPVRNGILSAAFPRLQRALPGSLVVESAAWPSLGSLRFEGVVWFEGPDTLAAARTLQVSADLFALARRDIYVKDLIVTGAFAEIPSIVDRFPPSEKAGGAAAETPAFPRTGSIPGVPSLAVDRLELDASHILLSEALELRDVELRAGADLRRGRAPRVTVTELTLTESVSRTSIDSLWFSADLSTFDFDGKGTVDVPGTQPWHLVCRSDPDHRFDLRLTAEQGASPPEVSGIALEGRAHLEDDRPVSADIELKFRTPGTEELLRVRALEPFLAGPLSKTAPLDALRGTVAGAISLEPEFAFDAVLDLYRNTWLDTVHAVVKHTALATAFEDVHVAAPGLELTASSQIRPAAGTARAHLIVTDSAWLTRVVPAVSLPEGTQADITVDADGLAASPEQRVSLRGNASVGNTKIDSVDITAVIPSDRNKPYDADILVAAMGTSLATRARVVTAPSIAVRFTESATHRGENVMTGGVGYAPRDRSVELDDLRLSGSLGNYTFNAALDGARRGSFAAICRWPAPPPLLFERTRADSAAVAAADSAWRADGPFDIRVDGDVSPTGTGTPPEITATAALRLPGPRHLAPLIGGAIDVEGLGPVEGSVRLTTGACDSTPSFAVRLDLGQTSWLDTALVDVAGCGHTIEIDKLVIAFESLRLAAEGGRENGEWDLRTRLVLADSLVLRRFLSGPELPSVRAQATVHLQGTAAAPRIAGELGARLRTADLDIPDVTAAVELDGGRLTARVRLPQGAHGYGLVVDSVAVDHAGNAGEPLSGRTTLAAIGPDLSARLALEWEKNGGLTVRGDTLYLAMLERDLRSKRPFLLDLEPEGEVRIERVALEGTAGRVTADGYVAPDSADFSADLVLHAPRKPRFLEFADRLWPDSVRVAARVDDPTTFRLNAVVEGIEISGQTPVRVTLDAYSNPDSTSARAAVESADRRLFQITGYLPSYRLGDKLGEGPVGLDARFDRFPLPADYRSLTADKPDILGWLDGRMALRGTAKDPSAIAELRCEFAPDVTGIELAKYRLQIEGELTGSAADTALVRLRRDWFPAGAPASGTTPGVAAALSMTKSGSPVLTGRLIYPVTVSLAPVSVATAPEAEMEFGFQTRSVALTDLDPLLPPDLDLEGTCTMELAAEGKVKNPALRGSLQTQDVQIVSAGGAQISPEINLNFGGTAARPSVEGNVLIRSGYIRIPEKKRQLYATSGRSILWEAADSARVTAGSLGRFAGTARGDSLEATRFGSELDLDVTVQIPGSFRIIGSRMTLELSGDLHVVQRGSRPVVTGQLTPEGGHLLFAGRTFQLQRGSVNFYGGDELNPSFDLTLVTEVADYRIEIRLTGTLKEPEITLSSDPQLAESDIMSLLMFGKQMGELDTSQTGLVQQRTAEILMVYGAVKLQEQMSKQMGVDILTVQQSKRNPDESALVVGKYLNNRTLIRYEQNLENSGAFLINLEYILTKRLKLETFVDQASTTGVEINWSKDY